MEQWKSDILAFFTKWAVWFCYIIIGVLAKISHDLYMKKKLSFWQSIGSMGVAGFIGYLATIFCISYGISQEKGGFIVPVCTLASKEVITWILTRNWGKILDNIYEGFKNKT